MTMFRRGFFSLAAPGLLINLVYLFVVRIKEEIPIEVLPLIYLLNTLVRDLAIYVILVALGCAIHRSRVFGILPAAIFILIRGTDAMMLYHGNTLLELHHLTSAKPGALGLYAMSPGTLALVGAAAVIFLLAVQSIRRYGGGVTFSELLVSSAVACLVFYFDFPESYYLYLRGAQSEHRAAIDVLNQRLDYLASNSVMNVTDQYIKNPTRKIRNVTDIDKFHDVLKKYGLPMGPRNYPDLGLKPFNRVIVLHAESLSLELLGGYNREIPPEVSPFYASDFVRERMFTNYRTTNAPTVPGLMGSFGSHPNAYNTALLEFPQSWVRKLPEQGFKTWFARSALQYYGRGNILFPRAGLENTISLEDFQRPEFAALTTGLGACDRLVFNKVIDVLREHRDEKIYVSILTVDTHGPDGRVDYGNLQYPPYPEVLKDPKYPPILRSIFRHDHDVNLFFDRLKEEGLWTEDTLLILTADHGHPLGPEMEAVPGYQRLKLPRVSFAVLTPQKLPDAVKDSIACQMDLGPTVLHLLGLPIPEGLWGESLFYPQRHGTYIGNFWHTLYIETKDLKYELDVNAPGNSEDAQIVDLFRSYFILGSRHKADEKPPAH